MLENRQSYLDTLAGIFICYMIFMHCLQFTNMNDSSFGNILGDIFSCFMAWFFFKSGMFHNWNISFKNEIVHMFNKLWRPYLLFWVIGLIINAICLYWDNDYNIIHYTLSPIKQTIWAGGSNAGALPMWFLVTLFIVKVFSHIIFKTFNGYGWILCGVIGFLLCSYGKIHPYYITNFFPAMFFYGLGNFMKEIQFKKTLIIIIASLIYIISFLYPSGVDFQSNTLCKGDFPLWYIYATSGIIIFNYVSKKLALTIYPFTYIGESSMYWYLAHWPILVIINRLYLNYSQISELRLAFLDFFTVMALLFVIKPIFKYTSLKKWI